MPEELVGAGGACGGCCTLYFWVLFRVQAMPVYVYNNSAMSADTIDHWYKMRTRCVIIQHTITHEAY